ncbi:hypothetical protein [Pseudalkalibacillus decolorationis]|uniref:hypothetical protein n=1 Tax=Pseudalkalibacillus decolorationis TaxID=163879 RepID=UPI0021478C3E|nr:hypothetical protein [Pseudalkalibacillus decolorationis]
MITYFDGENGNWLTTKNPEQLEVAGGLSNGLAPFSWSTEDNQKGWYQIQRLQLVCQTVVT